MSESGRPALASRKSVDNGGGGDTWRWIVVTALPVTAALGPYFLPIPLGGVTLFAYRALVLTVAVASVIFFARLAWWKIPIARAYALLGAFWIFWAAINSFRAPLLDRAALDVAALGFGFVAGIAMLHMRAYTLSALAALRRGWVLAFVATGAVAVWELTTGQHLPSSTVERVSEGALQGITISTFGNPNNYAAFLLLAAPFLFWSHASARSRWTRTFYVICLIALPALLFLTASRVALLGLVAEVAALWGLGRGHRMRAIGYVGLLLALGVLSFQLAGLELRMVTELSALLEGGSAGGSVAKRWNLLLSGLWLLAESMGFGVGPGGFVVLLQQGTAPYDTGGLVSPHNFWIEVLSQYGIPVFVGFILWILYLSRGAVRELMRNTDGSDYVAPRRVAETILVALAGYFFAAVANSSYMTQSTNWMFWASMVAMASFLWRRRIVTVDSADAADFDDTANSLGSASGAADG